MDSVSDPDLNILLLTVELVIPWARSLKDKRSAVHGLKARLRARFNAAVAEVDHHDKWQRAVLAVCMLGNDRRQLESDMAQVRRLCMEARDVQLGEQRQQWL